MTQNKRTPSRQDLATRILTSKHELSHALVAYALRCCDIEVRVFKRIIRARQTEFLGRCSYRHFKGCIHFNVFIGTAPFASPLYEVEADDFGELEQNVKLFRQLTGEGIPAFRAYVLKPIKEFLECRPTIEIIAHLARPLAEGQAIKAGRPASLERHFPGGINMTLLQAMCNGVWEAATTFPFVR